MTALNANAIEEARARYDAEARRLLSQRPILARVLLGTMRELAGLSPEEVEARIEGEPAVGEVPVGPGSAIRGGPTEDSVPGEGTVRFDVRTSVLAPGEPEQVRVIVNVESQGDCSPGYEVVTRGVLYAARLLSAQLEVEVTHSDYDSLKKVYSIWVCMGAVGGVGNAISAYSFSKRDLLGSLPDRKEAYDKAEVVIVALGGKGEGESGGELVDMLRLLFSPKVSREEKMRELAGRYNVPVRGDVEEGVNVMGNLSDYVMDYALEKGMAQGIERGMAQGMAQGMEKGMAQGMAQGMERKVAELALANLGRGLSYEQVAEFLGVSVPDVREIERKALATA